MEKKITFSAEDKGVATYMDRMKRSAEELGRMMIRDARAYTTSGNEVVKVIDEQIKAIEKRNRIEQQSRRAELDNSHQSGRINDTQYKKSITDIKQSTAEDKMQVSLLRELIETIKFQGKEELRAERKNVEDQIKVSKTVEKLNPEGDEMHLLKESIQKSELARVKKDEIEEQFWSNATKGKMAMGVNMLTGAVNSPNLYQGGVTAAGQLPAMMGAGVLTSALVGGVTSLISRGLREATGYEKGLGRLSAFSGLPQSDYLAAKIGRHVEDYGYTQEQYTNSMVENARAQGYAYKVYPKEHPKAGQMIPETLMNTTTTSNMQATKAYDIDMSTLTSLSRASRNERGGFNNSAEKLQALYGGMKGVHAASDDDKSMVPEYLQQLISVNQQQVSLLGSVNTKVTGGMLLGIAGMNKDFANSPEKMSAVVGGFQQGLGRSSIPQVEAMQLNVLSRMAPGKSYFEYRKMMENGSVLGDPKYASKYLEALNKQAGGNTELFADYISQTMFGGKQLQTSLDIAKSSQYRIARNMPAFQSGSMDKNRGIVNMDKAAGIDYGTGTLEKASVQTTNRFAQNGKELVDGMANLMETVKEGLGKVLDKQNKILEGQKQAADSLMRSANFFDKLRGSAIMGGAIQSTAYH